MDLNMTAWTCFSELLSKSHMFSRENDNLYSYLEFVAINVTYKLQIKIPFWHISPTFYFYFTHIEALTTQRDGILKHIKTK